MLSRFLNSQPQVVFEPAAPVGSKPSAGLLKGEGQGEGGEVEAEAPLFPHLVGEQCVESRVGWGRG